VSIEVKRCGNHWAVEWYDGGPRPPGYRCFNTQAEALEWARELKEKLKNRGTKRHSNAR
jgi:hypothetical protein